MRDLRVRLLTVFVVGLLFLYPKDSAAERIRIGTTPTGHLMWIADAKGYFAEQGVDVELVRYSSGVSASDALLRGEIDLANSSEFAFVSRAMERSDLRIVGSIARASSTLLFARADADIKSVEDLAGRHVGLTRHGIGEFFLGEFLAINGMAMSDLALVDLKAPDIVTEMAEKRIDAAITWEPFVYMAREKLGDKFYALPEQDSYYYHFVLSGLRSWTDTRRRKISAVLRALIAAEEFAVHEPAAAQKIYAARLGLDLKFVRDTWTRYVLEVTLQQTLLVLMEQEARWRIESGLSDASAIPDLLSMIDIEPLLAASPKAVQLIR